MKRYVRSATVDFVVYTSQTDEVASQPLNIISGSSDFAVSAGGCSTNRIQIGNQSSCTRVYIVPDKLAKQRIVIGPLLNEVQLGTVCLIPINSLDISS